MIKETIISHDLEGNEIKDDYWFNLYESELTELNYSKKGGLKKYIEDIIKIEDEAELIKIFKKIVLMAYGRKSEDGRRFIKSEEEATAFSQTEAYSNLFMKLARDANAASAFLTGVCPKQLQDNLPKTTKKSTKVSE